MLVSSGVLTITHSILIGSLTFGMLALFSAVLASFHKKHVFVTATVALEISSGIHYFITCCIVSFTILLFPNCVQLLTAEADCLFIEPYL